MKLDFYHLGFTYDLRKGHIEPIISSYFQFFSRKGQICKNSMPRKYNFEKDILNESSDFLKMISVFRFVGYILVKTHEMSLKTISLSTTQTELSFLCHYSEN